MSNEIWVINASPLILLGKLGRTDLLESLALQVIVPQSVFQEVAAGASDDAAMKEALNWASPRVQNDILIRYSDSTLYLRLGSGCWRIPSIGALPCRWAPGRAG